MIGRALTAALLLGAPGGYLLATQSDLGATGMWIANFAYAIVNSVVMIGWLLTGRWARRHRTSPAGGAGAPPS